MSEHVTLRAEDGHELDAYVARPEGEPLGGLVVVQEAFGVNHHIRSVADDYAKEGFLAVAPALYDRIERGVDLGYSDGDIQRGMAIARQGKPDDWVKDTAAALGYARQETGKKVGVIGYCLGGSVAWLASTRLNPDAAVSYYGGYVMTFAAEKPKAPIILHFGKQDQHIPEARINAAFRPSHPDIPIYFYDADHGFNCSERASYNEEAAQTARSRSLEFLKKHLTA